VLLHYFSAAELAIVMLLMGNGTTLHTEQAQVLTGPKMGEAAECEEAGLGVIRQSRVWIRVRSVSLGSNMGCDTLGLFKL